MSGRELGVEKASASILDLRESLVDKEEEDTTSPPPPVLHLPGPHLWTENFFFLGLPPLMRHYGAKNERGVTPYSDADETLAKSLLTL